MVSVMCASSTEPARVEALKAGSWGGMHMLMTVRADGADVEFDCATAAIPAAIAVDEKGAFDVPGKITMEGPGPAREGAAAQSVRFIGSLKSDELTVKVVYEDNSVFGTFTVVLAQKARLLKCR
jgi:hypothetical protein